MHFPASFSILDPNQGQREDRKWAKLRGRVYDLTGRGVTSTSSYSCDTPRFPWKLGAERGGRCKRPMRFKSFWRTQRVEVWDSGRVEEAWTSDFVSGHSLAPSFIITGGL
ncbi:MAG: hypothetical protein ACLR23_27735 [Clostridia bacterium]